jgi:hypothetical protein
LHQGSRHFQGARARPLDHDEQVAEPMPKEMSGSVRTRISEVNWRAVTNHPARRGDLRKASGRGQGCGSASRDSNPNIEALNSKQYQMTQAQMTKTSKPRQPDHSYLAMFNALEHSYFGFASDFEFVESTITPDRQSLLASHWQSWRFMRDYYAGAETRSPRNNAARASDQYSPSSLKETKPTCPPHEGISRYTLAWWEASVTG